MAKKQSPKTVENPGSMLSQKTNEDYNKNPPLLTDPNESKGKVNPERPNLADESKNILDTPPTTPGKRNKRNCTNT